jgi:NAD(P)-dependent dehydrogenase (short-subunit alcohol dehydrogenase family)
MPTAIITGAAQGIGRRTAELFAASGYSLVLIDLHSTAATADSAHNLAPPTTNSHASVILEFTGDITDEAFVTESIAAIHRRFERIDVLVNNAGISHIAPAETITAAAFRRVVEVNLVAPFLLARAAGSIMLAQHSGSIINIASIAGLFGVSDRAAYNASKHGLVGLTRTLAAEWGGRGVRVNAVCPGWVKTEMDHADQARGTYTDADITDRIPMGRFASPDDIARAVLFLANPAQSGFINGHTLTVDGGWTADASWQSLRLSHR